MPANVHTSNGIPLDSLGVNGDLCFDYFNRFYWGPKGHITSNSWIGTANNTVGQTGPAGASALTPYYGACMGPTVNIAAMPLLLLAVSTVPGSAYTPKQPSFFIGATYTVTQGSFVLELYDQTAGVSLWKSGTLQSGNSATVGPFPATSATYGGIPLVSGNTVVWRVGGSLTTASGTVDPVYYDTVQPPRFSMGTSVGGQYVASAVQSTTAQTMRIPGATANIKYFRPTKTAFLYQMVITNPGTSGYVTAFLASLGNASGDGAIVCRNIDNSSAVYQVPPQTTWTSPIYGQWFPLNPATNYAWYTQGTSNGICTVTSTILQ